MVQKIVKMNIAKRQLGNSSEDVAGTCVLFLSRNLHWLETVAFRLWLAFLSHFLNDFSADLLLSQAGAFDCDVRIFLVQR